MRNFLLFILLSCGTVPALGSHVIGGSLTYKCLGNGQFRFTLVMYRDCVGIPWNQNTVQLQGPVGGILNLIGSEDISPRCSTASQFTCSPVGGAQGTLGTTSKFTYAGVVNLSRLGPAPVNGGYTFYVVFPCCRNILSNMIGSDLGLQVKMFRYTHPVTGQVLTPAQLCDNSPEFMVDPTTALVVNPNDTVRLQNLAVDPDGDLVVHSIDFPVNNFLAPYAYTPPYSSLAPLPAMVGAPVVQPQNNPIHRALGEVVFRPTVSGNFICVTRADGYRNGQLVSQAYRDVSLVILPNSPVFPLPSSNILFNQKPPQVNPAVLKAEGGRSSFEWDFYVGDSIDLLLNAQDLFPTLIGDPSLPSTWQPSEEALQLAIQGSAMSNTNQVSAGCANPPCATISNSLQPSATPSIINFGNGLFMGNGYQFASQGNAKVRWVPSCISLPPRADTVLNLVHSYGFMVRSADRNCVMQGRTDRAMVVRVLSKPLIPGPNFTTLQFDTLNQRYRLQWTSLLDTVNADSVDQRNWTGLLSQQEILAKSVNRRRSSVTAYRVYRSINGGPWQLAGSIPPFNSVFYQDTLRFPTSHDVAYQVRTVSGCHSIELGSQIQRNSFFSTSVDDKKMGEFKLWPNPGQGRYSITTQGTNLPKDLELRDLQGRLLFSWNLTEFEKFDFELVDLPAGVYIIQSQSSEMRLKLVHRP